MVKKKDQTVDLKIQATLRLRPEDLAYLDDESLEKLHGIVTELTYQRFQIKFRNMRGHIEFMTPHPTELKQARMRHLGQS